MTKWIQTVTGPVAADSLGLILPHEHLFTDLRGPAVPSYAQGNPDQVVDVLRPYLSAAAAAGVTAMVECSTLGVGRNLLVLRRVAETMPIRIIAPTGVYREAFTPPDLRETTVEALAGLWTRELSEGIEGTKIRAGFIKLALSDEGPTELEIRNLKAAARASRATGAVIASHTIGGAAARREMDVLETEGLDLHRFIWVHAQTEPDRAVQREAAKRGAYIELDSIGANREWNADMIEMTLALVEAGHIEQILLSHDAGWYNPARADGMPEGGFRGYTALSEDLIPALRQRGVSDEQIQMITVQNPARAFAF